MVRCCVVYMYDCEPAHIPVLMVIFTSLPTPSLLIPSHSFILDCVEVCGCVHALPSLLYVCVWQYCLCASDTEADDVMLIPTALCKHNAGFC